MIIFKYLFIFCIFSVVGWILEFIYRSIIIKKIVNPGFMSGFVVPLYGFGAVILNIISNTFNNIIIIFILSIVLLSLLEYITGYVLLKYLSIRLWDYSCRKFNINGFICLRFSLTWGLFAIMYYLFIFKFINEYSLEFISNSYCLFSVNIFLLVLLIDLFISLNTNKLKKK